MRTDPIDKLLYGGGHIQLFLGKSLIRSGFPGWRAELMRDAGCPVATRDIALPCT
jgi:hypothetical protein